GARGGTASRHRRRPTPRRGGLQSRGDDHRRVPYLSVPPTDFAGYTQSRTASHTLPQRLQVVLPCQPRFPQSGHCTRTRRGSNSDLNCKSPKGNLAQISWICLRREVNPLRISPKAVTRACSGCSSDKLRCLETACTRA